MLDSLIQQIQDAPYLSTDVKNHIIVLLEKKPEKAEILQDLMNQYDIKYLESLETLVTSIDHMYEDINSDMKENLDTRQSKVLDVMNSLVVEAVRKSITQSF